MKTDTNRTNNTLHSNLPQVILFIYSLVGIPIIYYGTEQAFHGANDPNDREILWNHFNPYNILEYLRNHDLYKFIQTINQARKATNSASQPQIESYVDAEIFAFTRGQLFAAFTSKLDRIVHKVITYHPYTEGLFTNL
jgi:alpha-amylase